MIGYYDAIVSKSDIVISTLTNAQGAAIGIQYGGYVDSERGKYVKTHGYIESYAGEDVGDDWVSSTGSLTIGSQVVYHLSTATEYDIANLPLIYAGKGITSISTGNGNVELTGAIDPRWERDDLKHSIEQLSAAIVALGGTI